MDEQDDTLTWSVTNGSAAPAAVDAVAVVGWVGPVGADPRMFVNGYQSWSPTGMRHIGVDPDPSPTTTHDAIRGVYHADPHATSVLRSELVTVIDLDTGAPSIAIGFDGALDHDGTIRVEREDDGLLVTVEAWLGGVELAPRETRVLHAVRMEQGDDPSLLLEAWAGRIGDSQRARIAAPYRVGWCSWYQYFDEITEATLRENLARAVDWPFDVFQLDDGYQRAIGDWLTTGARFPSDLASIADAIRDAGLTPGIWLAPFLAHTESQTGRVHSEWFARERDHDRRLVGMTNDHWGGVVHILDTTHPEVLEHLETTAAALVDAGFAYLKLDFTYAPSLPGRFHDASRTPAQRVRSGYDAIRRGTGEDAFLLGCGAPLGPCVGVVDGMRIGPDVAPRWQPEPTGIGYENAAPAVVNAWRSTLARSFMHRKLWLNDPDCLMLRREQTELTAPAVRTWALAVGTSGGMPIISDELALLGANARILLDEVLELGRAADGESVAGTPPRCPDLMEHAAPTRLAVAGRELVADLDVPSARFEDARPVSGGRGI